MWWWWSRLLSSSFQCIVSLEFRKFRDLDEPFLSQFTIVHLLLSSSLCCDADRPIVGCIGMHLLFCDEVSCSSIETQTTMTKRTVPCENRKCMLPVPRSRVCFSRDRLSSESISRQRLTDNESEATSRRRRVEPYGRGTAPSHVWRTRHALWLRPAQRYSDSQRASAGHRMHRAATRRYWTIWRLRAQVSCAKIILIDSLRTHLNNSLTYTDNSIPVYYYCQF